MQREFKGIVTANICSLHTLERGATGRNFSFSFSAFPREKLLFKLQE
jgi:hypothetical protein